MDNHVETNTEVVCDVLKDGGELCMEIPLLFNAVRQSLVTYRWRARHFPSGVNWVLHRGLSRWMTILW